ncbi:MAG: EAL domain-containing protein [Acidobacteriota bacterium]
MAMMHSHSPVSAMESETLDSAWFDHAPVALVLCRGAQPVAVNDRALDLFGRPRWELLDGPLSTWAETFGAAELECFLSDNGTPSAESLEVAFQRSDGERRWFELSKGLLPGVDESEDILLAVADITAFKELEQIGRQQQTRLKLAQRAGRSVTWNWDVEADHVSAPGEEEALRQLTGGEGPLRRHDLVKFVQPVDQAALQEALQRTVQSGQPLAIEVNTLLPAAPTVGVHPGGYRRVLLRGAAVDGPRRRVVGVATDVTERHRTEEALRVERARAEVTLRAIGDAVIRTDAAGQIDFLNTAAETLLGTGGVDLRGRSFERAVRLLDSASRQPMADPLRRCLQAEGAMHCSLLGPGGERDIRLLASALRDGEGVVEGMVLVVRDLTEEQTAARQATYLSTHDELTGLARRPEFESRLQAVIEEAAKGQPEEALALCHLDFDSLELVDEVNGLGAGNEVLSQSASLLKCLLSGRDVLGRLEGSQIGILLRDCPPEKAREITDGLLRELVSMRFGGAGRGFQVRASLGLVFVSLRGGAEQAMETAAAAAAAARRKGGNQIREYRPDDDELSDRWSLVDRVRAIHHALESDGLRLFSQTVRPVVDRESAGAEGCERFELSVRMVGASGELLESEEFLPIAEKHRLSAAIDRWVVSRACEILVTEKRPVRVGIPLSRQSIADPSFVTFARAQTRRLDTERRRILFIITEDADSPETRRHMSELREQGFRFVLADFGRGRSSFATLRELPVDFLKIDGNLVRGMTADPTQQALVEAVNHIGHVMQLKTIAEGVDEAATLDLLRRMRVDFAQGSWVGSPKSRAVSTGPGPSAEA